MSYSLYTVFQDHRDQLVAQLAKTVTKQAPDFAKLGKQRLKEDCEYLFDGAVDRICTGDEGGLRTFFGYLVRRTASGFDFADAARAVLAMNAVMRQFLQAAYREQVVGGGRGAYEEAMTAVEEGCNEAVIVLCDVFQNHVQSRVAEHNEDGKKLGEEFNRLILFKG
jgi:hypothetical protein